MCANTSFPTETMEIDVANIMQRLHRSTHMHFQRTTSHGVIIFARDKNAAAANRRQTIERVFRTRQDDETLIEVARRLHALVQKKRTRRLAKLQKMKSSNGLNQSCVVKSTSHATSSLEENEYLGDWSTLSSANFSLDDRKDIGS
jgi:hypothetical protein